MNEVTTEVVEPVQVSEVKLTKEEFEAKVNAKIAKDLEDQESKDKVPF